MRIFFLNVFHHFILFVISVKEGDSIFKSIFHLCKISKVWWTRTKNEREREWKKWERKWRLPQFFLLHSSFSFYIFHVGELMAMEQAILCYDICAVNIKRKSRMLSINFSFSIRILYAAFYFFFSNFLALFSLLIFEEIYFFRFIQKCGKIKIFCVAIIFFISFLNTTTLFPKEKNKIDFMWQHRIEKIPADSRY